MSVFADSSALVKLYADEDGHEAVRGLGALLVSQIARVEVPAALWRKQRVDDLDEADKAVLVAEFEADFFGTAEEEPRFAVVALSSGVLESAARLTAAHGLRACDAVQLASAVAAAEAEAACTTFAAFDRPLRRAAASEGFRLEP